MPSETINDIVDAVRQFLGFTKVSFRPATIKTKWIAGMDSARRLGQRQGSRQPQFMQPDSTSPTSTMSLTLRAAFDEYSKFRLRGSRDNTRKKFSYALDHWAALLGREPSLADAATGNTLCALPQAIAELDPPG